MVSSTTPRFGPRWPPVRATVATRNRRISAASSVSSAGPSLRRSAGPRTRRNTLTGPVYGRAAKAPGGAEHPDGCPRERSAGRRPGQGGWRGHREAAGGPVPHDVATVPLGGVERGVRGAEHLLQRTGAAEVEHRPDGRRQPLDRQRAVRGVHADAQLLDPRPDPLGHRLELTPAGAGEFEVTEQDDELLAAEPADDVALPHLGAQRGRHRDEHLVAREVPVGVVDRLEVIEVEDEHARRDALAL